MDLESYGVGNEAIDLEKLDRTWRLQYTSASDVLGRIEVKRLICP